MATTTTIFQSPSVPADYFDGVFDYIKNMLMEEDDDAAAYSDDHHRLSYSQLQACENAFLHALLDTTAPHSIDDDDASNFNRKKKDRNCSREDSDELDRRSTKQSAPAMFDDDDERPVTTGNFDRALFCEKMNPGFYDDDNDDDLSRAALSGDEFDTKYKKPPESKRGRPKGTTKKRPPPPRPPAVAKEVVDLHTLLTRCAQAVSTSDHLVARQILATIRHHASPYADANARLSHCFANALEARLSGTGSTLYASSSTRRISTVDHLKAYQSSITACPFKRMSNIFANKSIAKHTRQADKIHIIDFGISYGFQWPCIIQGVSLRPNGPPSLKITGIDLPEPGFKPGEKVEQTGRRLASFCNRFNVPFEYNAIAKNFVDINVDDLKLEPNEMVVVNCLYRMRHVPDESRDTVLNLIKTINPCIFVHGVVNGTYNVPFFTTRFKEALYHYSSFFDMMEATMPREDEERMIYERDVFGREVMNAVACEGWERVDRPESYKQWGKRNRRAGFRKVPLDRGIVEEVRVKVKGGYNGDFMVEEDDIWLVQGWKGRPLYALSCWRPHE